jgi:hydroxyethylthiazole kinase-like uncharacterized protein yjeF
MGIPLLTVAQLRAAEQTAALSLPPGELMQRAGKAASHAIDKFGTQRTEGKKPLTICIVCGPGNNGGDGFVAAAALQSAGHQVKCYLVGCERPTARDALAAFEHWRSSGGEISRVLPQGIQFDVVVDALFGIGLARPLAGDFLAAVNWMNAQPAVSAIDLPSGLDADSGSWVGGVAGVRADLTVSFIADKPGLHTAEGVDAAGRILIDGLGVALPEAGVSLVEPADFPELLLPRQRNSHKGKFGNVAIVGGGRGMVGAALLAGRAALRLGAGRVFVDLIGAPELGVDPQQPELMLRPVSTVGELQANVVGCGLGVDPTARAALLAAIERAVALVLDADALSLLASDSTLLDRVRERSASTVLTPHPLEAARLLACTATEVQANRIQATQRIARNCNAIVVLKGAGSVIAGPGGNLAINPTGSAALATAGTGDVLAGMIGALLAQRFEPWQATIAAVWLHGRGGEGCGGVGLLASELAQRSVEVLRALRAESGPSRQPGN